MIGLRISAIFISCLIAAASAGKCLLETTEHCECYNDKGILDIHCNRVANLTDELFKVADVKNILIDLSITFWTETSIPSGYFREATFRKVYVSRADVRTVAGNVLEGSENTLESIVCDKCTNLRSFADTRKFTKLTTVGIGGSPQVFNGKLSCDILQFFPSGIVHLSLSNNNIASIDLTCTERFTKLKYAFFYKNPLRSFQGDKLPRSLEHLSLAFTDITVIPTKLLTTLPEGANIDLGYNKIANFRKEEILPLLKKKFHLQLKGNEIQCDCVMSWIPSFVKEYGEKLAELLPKTPRMECKGHNFRLGAKIIELHDADFEDCK